MLTERLNNLGGFFLVFLSFSYTLSFVTDTSSRCAVVSQQSGQVRLETSKCPEQPAGSPIQTRETLCSLSLEYFKTRNLSQTLRIAYALVATR